MTHLHTAALAAIAALATLAAAPAVAQSTVTLDFEGAAGYVNGIGEYYNGGTDSLGQSGPDYGVSFSDAAVALSNDALGPYFANAPTPLTVMFDFDGSAVMNVSAGIVEGLSFYYAASQNVLDAVNIWSGPNATGTLLASASLFGNAAIGCTEPAYCRFDLTSVRFAGVAQSVSFGGDAPNVLFDDITVTVVPEPATYLMFGAGLAAVGLAKRRRQPKR